MASIEDDPELSTLLALEAVDETRDGAAARPEAIEALHRAVSSNRLLMDVPGVGGALDWSPTGEVFVTEGQEETGIVDIRDAATGASIREFHGHAIDVNDVAFSADGTLLATTGDDAALRVWDVATGDLVREFVPFDGDAVVWGPSFSPDGSRVAASWYEGDLASVVRVFDVATGALTRTLIAAAVNATAFSPDGRRLAVGDNGGEHAAVFDLATGEEVFTVGAGQLWVNDVAFSPDGRWLATSGGDATARVWDAVTGEPALTIAAHDGPVYVLDWNADGSALATATSEGTAKVFDISDGAWVERSSVSAASTSNGIAGVAFSPDGQRLMTGDFAIESVKVWDVSPTGGGELFNLAGLDGLAGTVAFDDDGRLFTSAPDGSLDVSDGRTGQLLGTVHRPKEGVLFALAPAGDLVATTTSDLPVQIRTTSTGELVGELTKEGGAYVADMDWDPTGTYLAIAIASDVGEIVVLDRSGVEVARLPGDLDLYVRAVAFDATGDRIFAARWPDRSQPGSQGTTIWEWRTADIVGQLAESATALAVDPTGRYVASARELESFVDVWDATTGAPVAVLRGQAPSNALTFTADGSRLLTADTDGRVRVWDPAAGTQSLALPHEQEVVWLAMGPDGRRVASVTVDGSIRVWTLDLDELVTLAEHRLTRGFSDGECRQYLHVERCPEP